MARATTVSSLENVTMGTFLSVRELLHVSTAVRRKQATYFVACFFLAAVDSNIFQFIPSTSQLRLLARH